MQAAKTGKARLFETGNKFKHMRLFAIFKLGLKAHHIEQSAERIILAQLHHGMRFHVGRMHIGQATRFHRAVAQSIATARGHNFNRQAAIEIGRVGFPLFKIGGVALDERVEESIILGFIHRAVDVIFARAARPDFIVARLIPADIHIDTVVINNRRNGIEKGQFIAARHLANLLG